MSIRAVLASGNRGKLAEFQALLAPHFALVPQTELGVRAAAETGLTFVENALLKARAAAAQTGLPALADDSGLMVDALDGAPGLYSARYAGDNADDAANNRLLLERLHGVAGPQRGARFHCALVYLRCAADPVPLICQGSWEGRILSAPAGSGGFGYDPLFFALEQGCVAACLPPQRKNQVSHRGRAVRQLIELLAAERAADSVAALPD
ncbi:MAG: RdgB/HAM1 family non-canonical purine NTP pyrophosphatase [Cellvibrionales bacterium]|nr:RdgB/HAM1 family non-canonical purine NTP pyrophosphatase [Cellvibrionales bacterium]